MHMCMYSGCDYTTLYSYYTTQFALILENKTSE